MTRLDAPLLGIAHAACPLTVFRPEVSLHPTT